MKPVVAPPEASGTKPLRPRAGRISRATLGLAATLLRRVESVRPVSTVEWGVQAGLASMPSEPRTSATRRLEINLDLWLDALFGDWGMNAGWTESEIQVGHALLPKLFMESQAALPALPRFPARPSFGGPTLDKLWHHVDLAGWRMHRFLMAPGEDRDLGRERGLFVERLFRDSVDLLDHFQRMTFMPFSTHAASALDYTEELADLLHRLHEALDEAAGEWNGDPLNWPIPDYRPFRAAPFPLPEGPRGPALPHGLIQSLEEALEARQCFRPVSTALPLVQIYGAMKAALSPDWVWSPARDARECAFILFESSPKELPDWTPGQARSLGRICTALWQWGEGQPQPSLPSLDLATEEDPRTLLWRHQDLIFLLGSTLGPELGFIPSPDDSGSFKRERRLRQQWGDLQGILWGALDRWDEDAFAGQPPPLSALAMALAVMYQSFRNEIAAVDRTFLPFIPKPQEHLLPRPKGPRARFGRIKRR